MLAGALELVLISLGLTYYVATAGAGLRVLRRARRPGQAGESTASTAARPGRLRSRLQAAGEPPSRAGVVVPPEDGVVYFVVPCMNEETVIGETVNSLLSDHRALVVVVDDASDDKAGELAAAVDSSRVMVIRRELPEARLGPGPALNAGFACVLRDAGIRGIPASRITVCVMDAGGVLSAGALDAVLPLFADQRVGAVQLPVAIRDRGSLLTVLQDLELWGVRAAAQLGIASGPVSPGGSGQFARLAAILELGARPWQAQPAAGMNLALALAVRGWRLTSTAGAHVSQPGVSSLRALLSQRTRWYQGHLQAVRRLRELRSSRQLPYLAMLKLTACLLVPPALVLPWSIIFNYNLLIMVLWILGWRSGAGPGADLTQKIVTVVFWSALSFLPACMAGFLYGRRERKAGFVRAFFTGSLLLFGSYVTYAACWRAACRLITGTHGGEKAQRTTGRRRQPAPVPARHAPAAPAAPASPASPGPAGARLASSGLGGAGPAAGSVGGCPAAILVPGPRIAGGGIMADDAGTMASLPAVPSPAGGRPGGGRPAEPPARRSGRRAPGSHRASRIRGGRRLARPSR